MQDIDSIMNGLNLALYVLTSICNVVIFAITLSVFVDPPCIWLNGTVFCNVATNILFSRRNILLEMIIDLHCLETDKSSIFDSSKVLLFLSIGDNTFMSYMMLSRAMAFSKGLHS